MATLIFAAFSLISVPAYVAMFSNDEDLDMDDEIEAEGPYCISPGRSEELAAATAQRSAPTSGLFQLGRLRRLM